MGNITPFWVHLPRRDTAINLARVTRIEFYDGRQATLYFDHAESADGDYPRFLATAQLALVAPEDTAALRRALGLPDAAD